MCIRDSPSLARFIKRYSGYNAKMTETAPVDIDEKMDDGIGHRMMMLSLIHIFGAPARRGPW